MRLKTTRTEFRFNITPNSHPRKVQRWMAKGGGIIVDAEKAAKRHIHPRRLRNDARA